MCSSAAEYAEDVLPSELHAPRRKPWEGEKKKWCLEEKRATPPFLLNLLILLRLKPFSYFFPRPANDRYIHQASFFSGQDATRRGTTP